MAWQDRSYHRSDPSSPFSSFGGRASVVTWLIGINAVVFLLDNILFNSNRGNWLAPWGWGSFSVTKAIGSLQLWRFVTYQFIHANFFHVFFNMLAVYFFGPIMERWWGSRRFLIFYLLCGVSGAVVFSLLLSLAPGLLSTSADSSLVGASGSVFGILIGCAIAAPNQRVMLIFPPIPMTMKTLALVFLGIAGLSVLADSMNAGGEVAHLGGAALGWVLMKKPRWVDLFDRQWLTRLQRAHTQFHRSRHQEEEAQVDRILDKVRRHGLTSLSSREKKVLKRATDRHRGVD